MSSALDFGRRCVPIQPLTAGGTLKLLLTSGGVTNPSIRNALVELLGKPIADCDALCIPTAEYGHRSGVRHR